MAITIRSAEPSECSALSDLALRSKAHWGYDASFLDACRAELTLDTADIERLQVRVAEESGTAVGFYALAADPPNGELGLFFVEPARIQTGVGRALWHDALATAARAGLAHVRVESDPFAESFYRAMGAVRVGEAPSRSIPNRSLPLLSIEIGQAPVALQPVRALADRVERVLQAVRSELRELVPGVPVEHIGATSLPDGLTKGDVDVDLRVGSDRFEAVVTALSRRFEIAQPQNWTGAFGSFTADRFDLPLGIQVTVEGSDDDFLVTLRNRLRDDPALRRQYERVKKEAAPAGADAYWRAKNHFLRSLLASTTPVGADGVEVSSVSSVELRGHGILLRELRKDDAEALLRVFSDPEVVRYLTLPAQTLDSEARFLATAAEEARRVPRHDYQLAITIDAGHEVVGTCRIGIDSVEQRSATIGYAIRRDLWGQGITTAVVRMLVEFGFETLGVHRIWATHHPDNPASGRVLIKVGFQPEGTIRDHMFVKDKWRDAVSYSLLENDRKRRGGENDSAKQRRT